MITLNDESVAPVADDRDLNPARELRGELPPLHSISAPESGAAASLEQVNSLQMEALNTVAFPIFAVLGDGYLVFANRAGHAALRAEHWVRWWGRRIAAGTELWKRQVLEKAIGELRSGRSTTALLTDGATGGQAVLVAVPLSEIVAPSLNPGGLIWLIPTATAAAPLGQFVHIFGLTNAERRVLQQLVAGEELRAAAGRLHISVHTARNHLKSIFQKTGRRRQGQVLALAHRMAAVHAGPNLSAEM